MIIGSLQILLLSFCTAAVSATSSCRDGNGKTVDWFIAIKLPYSLQYYVMTSASPQWAMSNCTVSSRCGSIYNTVKQAYGHRSSESTVSIIYNGQKPRSYYSSTYGHMKGVLSFEVEGTGFWMIHSVPKFPGRYRYNYPRSGRRYGQHFFCVTYRYSQLAAIVHQLSIARPKVYAHHVPDSVLSEIPDIDNLVNNERPSSTELSLIKTLTSANGISFVSFSKSRNFGKDLYRDLVAPDLRTGLFMEGWVNGRGSMSSDCSQTYPVYRITYVQLKDRNWKTTKDHSKWAVSNSAAKPWVCLGDINRQRSQFRRGGGTLCFRNKTVWKAFRAMVDDYQECYSEE